MGIRTSWRVAGAVVLAGSLTMGSAGPRSTFKRAQSHPASRSLAFLVAQSTPIRNLYQLAEQLRLHPPRPIAHVIRKSSPNYPVGHQDKFHVLSEDQNRYFTMTATIVAETPHLYIYAEKGAHVNAAAARAAADTFERHIYPTDRSYFGSQWNPGVDHDPHITCLIGDLKTAQAGGYYSAEDEYPRIVNPWSNQREMIYMNSAAGTVPGNGSFLLTMSHEFQHMIHWHMHQRDNAWLNEGMSMLAELLNHYPPQGEPQTFVQYPTTQLNSWTLTDPSNIAHYGAAYLYLTYLYDRFGRGLIHDLLSTGKYTDFELINAVLKHRHISQSADQIFAQWVIANYLNNRSIDHGVYGYKEVNFKVIANEHKQVPFTFGGKAPPYAAQYVVMSSLQNQKPFQLSFSAPTTVPVVSAGQGTPFWWSNRSDMSDTRLERTVDLTHVRQAALHFQAWYDIEKDYDYNYVEASRDGGKTWATLRGTHTTSSNPNGANYGNGYTGSSKTWRPETVNLSRYAGQRIRLRFQYITDDEFNGEGMAVKNITIPAIGFHDSFTGWNVQGFVPVTHNSISSRWHVELISETAHGTSVSTIPLSRNDRGSILINPASNGLQKLVVAVYTTAPKTTVQSSYTLVAK